MKLNQNTKLIAHNVTLIPYKRHHVPKYHKWMQSEELLQLTASEALGLREEYDMQKSWHLDEEKLTFLLLDRTRRRRRRDSDADADADVTEDANGSNNVDNNATTNQESGDTRESYNDDEDDNRQLCGDVNLFLQPDFDDTGLKIAELEIMIAEKQSRRKGIALEALKVMMCYAIEKLGIELFVVHILQQNEISKVLFEKKLHFQVKKFQEWSGEWILEKKVQDGSNWAQKLMEEMSYVKEEWIAWDEDDEDEEEEGEHTTLSHESEDTAGAAKVEQEEENNC